MGLGNKIQNDYNEDLGNNIQNNNDEDHGNNRKNDDVDDENIKTEQKRDCNGEVISFCKNRLLQLINAIVSHGDPHNNDCYDKKFVRMESQYEMTKTIFPRIE